MSVNRLEVLDLVIGVLREHEKKLDATSARLEELVTQLAKELNISNYMRSGGPK